MIEITDSPRRADPALLAELGQQLRVDTIRAVALAGSGDPSSALSAADLIIGGSRVLRSSDRDDVPLDTATVLEAAGATRRVVVTEDHWAQGGLADAVLQALADADVHTHVRRLAVTAMPTSGGPEELLRWAQIDRDHIARTARSLIAETPEHVRRAA